MLYVFQALFVFTAFLLKSFLTYRPYLVSRSSSFISFQPSSCLKKVFDEEVNKGKDEKQALNIILSGFGRYNSLMLAQTRQP
jgi:hypothetical protein